MAETTGKFTISYSDPARPQVRIEGEGIYIGRLDRCEVKLDHPAVSRVHAAIRFVDEKYSLVNLSESNVLTLNGRLLAAQRSDIIADGDTLQIGPFTIKAAISETELFLVVEEFAGRIAGPEKTDAPPVKPRQSAVDGVLKVFWEKRSRAKEDRGTRLRPTEIPRPGKAMFNWRPTTDLRRPWRVGLFIWAFLLLAAVGVYAYFRYPQAYAPKPLARAHSEKIDSGLIAAEPNGNSCTTCHTPNEPLENSCIRCHQGSEFHASNTLAHQQAGVTCTSCHKDHRGTDFDMVTTAITSCAECHNDGNRNTYNGRTVQTAHQGSYGYPLIDGVWKWRGVSREVANAIPEINDSVTGDRSEQTKLSRYFHTIHVGRLKVPAGVQGDKRGLVSCSTCHKTSDPIDRETPRQTCAACHTTGDAAAVKDPRFAKGTSNCISCHVQHPFSTRRWQEFLTDGALQRRNDAVANKIRELTSK